MAGHLDTTHAPCSAHTPLGQACGIRTKRASAGGPVPTAGERLRAIIAVVSPLRPAPTVHGARFGRPGPTPPRAVICANAAVPAARGTLGGPTQAQSSLMKGPLAQPGEMCSDEGPPAWAVACAAVAVPAARGILADPTQAQSSLMKGPWPNPVRCAPMKGNQEGCC